MVYKIMSAFSLYNRKDTPTPNTVVQTMTTPETVITTKKSHHTMLDSMLVKALETNVSLTPREIVLVQTIFSDKIVGDKINKLFGKILEDGKIDIYDVPNLILVLTEIYKTYIVEKRVENVNIISMIELTLDCILDCDLVPIPEFEKKIMKSVIETSLKLLETNLPIIKKGCFSFCHFMFGGCCGW